MDNEFITDMTELNTPPEIKKANTMIVLREQTLFPYQNTQFEIIGEKAILALNKALGQPEKTVFIATQRRANLTNVGPKDIFRVGVLATIKQLIKLQNDTFRVVVSVLERKEIENYVSITPFFEVQLKDLRVVVESDREIQATHRGLINLLDEYRKLEPKKNLEQLNNANIAEPEKMVYLLASTIFSTELDRNKILSEPSLIVQMEECAAKLANEIDLVGIERGLQAKVKKRIDKNQKEYFLREQQKVISEELGDNEEDIVKFREKLDLCGFDADTKERLLKDINRLASTATQSPEYGVLRTYLDTVFELPWNVSSDTNFDIKEAKLQLDLNHFGLEKVKDRIIEYLAVAKLTDALKAPILCFVGPPGVGKTSIVESIAKASGRKFVSMSLGGVRDEAEIRGHRKTYIGSMPGRIIAGLKNAKTNNPVFLLDEIDKMSSDFRGDPANALLEVLDPNQNHNFKDHYIDLPFDLSKVLFVTTANSLDTIPLPLLDRMELIEISGYTFEEKHNIATKYLVPKQIVQNGLTDKNILFSDDAIDELIEGYTSESGVRSLERQIGTVCRKIAVKVLEYSEYNANIDSVAEYLGAAKINKKNKRSVDEIGVANGLAWTAVGGKTLNVEVVAIQGGKGDIKLTGQIGDVMQESCHTAFSLVKSRATKYNVNPDDFKNNDFHVHFPEGATKKDGPSAGITISTAIMSVLTKRAVNHKMAMTGEVTLTGRVLAIGGLKEKTLAALRDGITTLIIAKENYKDIDEIPKSVQEKIKIKWVSMIDEVFDIVLMPTK